MKLLMLAISLFLPLAALAQGENSCCASHPAHAMAMLNNDQSFTTAHLPPLPFNFAPEKGRFISFITSDTLVGRAFEVPSEKPTTKVIFLFHEWWGLNDYIRQEAERLQKELGDVTVLALDLYDGKVTSSPEEAGKLTRTVTVERATSIIKGALEHVGADAKVGTVGWCFGGGWSMQAALIVGKQTAACVVYYGMPESDAERLKALSAPVLGIFAKQDKWITPEKIKEFEKAMKKVRKQLTVKMYDADHAFANPSNPKHDKEAAADAYKHTVEFFKKHLIK